MSILESGFQGDRERGQRLPDTGITCGKSRVSDEELKRQVRDRTLRQE
ncbi:MAG: hypothetical protein JGK24_32435 [Microcoleus sp. PH2017_29_MFU_D_A]|nr:MULTISPECIES: hypothetical protein [unclassified Microcoleus]MCC3422061.1 hypothetical protein [Microcoleus sp. PH2017_07_MST_O_A]MCC3432142.1 hypothetical protein [Microcoleus sp. PH2017_04_SCI_O_A]MCC3445263.1 hypothetical protein [Microcoleus sp. PH2017_03_ELD_O_A]MCC3469248.1 hypothetical protein [Microcoleus sp. PH2017_06_SFM_O_A]MCC3507327.1 hypothetical protein [Microcoleus sp. PH2017_19_SFW_U_A]MCC3513473.1 hypothetical protein [Microcoleus sp. PH2017_17_BER_D_A]